MTQEELVGKLAKYGYPLLEPALHQPEEVLENLLEQDDPRLLEGFPVVLRNALNEKDLLEWERPDWRPLRLSGKAQKRLHYLLVLSYLLFQSFRLGPGPVSRTYRLLSKLPRGLKVLKELEKTYAKSESFRVAGQKFSTQRFRTAFQTSGPYPQKDEALEKKRSVLEFELLLSEVFAPRQKELLRRKLEGKPLSKTEKEYFSRVVKKRLKALASEDLHRMARRVLDTL